MKEKPPLQMSGPADFVAGHPVLDRIARAAGDSRLFLVGGGVRDALLGIEATDLDLVLEGDAIELALRLDDDAVTHDRFGTAEFELGGLKIDLVTARTEKYAHPGSLPDVTPATLEDDLDRRDFTINAIAVDVGDPKVPIDPLGGIADLERGVLRVLHGVSFMDDPTRALRAARYAARFGFALEPVTADLLAGVNLSTVSSERVRAELELIAAEDEAMKALGLVSQWGLMHIDPDRMLLASTAIERAGMPPWRGTCSREDLILEAVFGEGIPSEWLDDNDPGSPSEAVFMARELNDCQQLLAQADGHEWLDRYRQEWRSVSLEITGDDLIKAGIPQGPAVGRGLDAALKSKLDDDVSGFDDELAVALAAARS